MRSSKGHDVGFHEPRTATRPNSAIGCSGPSGVGTICGTYGNHIDAIRGRLNSVEAECSIGFTIVAARYGTNCFAISQQNVQRRCPRIDVIILHRQVWAKADIYEIVPMRLKDILNSTQNRIDFKVIISRISAQNAPVIDIRIRTIRPNTGLQRPKQKSRGHSQSVALMTRNGIANAWRLPLAYPPFERVLQRKSAIHNGHAQFRHHGFLIGKLDPKAGNHRTNERVQRHHSWHPANRPQEGKFGNLWQ